MGRRRVPPSGSRGSGAERGVAPRGATLVEYALALAALCVAIIGGVELLTDAGRDELANQANCVETRPPPVSCQIRAITTSTSSGPVSTAAPTTTSTAPATTTTAAPTTTTTASTTTTTAPAPTTTTTTTTTTVRYSFQASASGANQNANQWRATVTVTAAPSTTGTTSGVFRPNGTGTAVAFTCAWSAGSCRFTTGNQARASVASVQFTVQSSTATPNDLPVTATANRPSS